MSRKALLAMVSPKQIVCLGLEVGTFGVGWKSRGDKCIKYFLITETFHSLLQACNLRCVGHRMIPLLRELEYFWLFFRPDGTINLLPLDISPIFYMGR